MGDFLLLFCLSKEIDPKMRYGLQHRLPADTHVFGNILDVFGDGDQTYRHLRNFPNYYTQVAFAQNLELATHAWCHAHDALCPLDTQGVIRVGGWPCQDYSRAGQQAGVAGQNFPACLSFGAKCALSQTPTVCIECVEGLPRHVPRDVLGGSYEFVLESIVQPSLVGFQHISRRRLKGDVLRC